MNATIPDVLIFLVAQIRALGYDVYTGLAPQGAKYPFVTLNIVATTPEYSLGGNSGIRIDTHVMSVAIFDKNRNAPNTILSWDQGIGQLIEGLFNQEQNQTTIMGFDRGRTIGPLWLEHENNWMLTSEWQIRAYANGQLPAEAS
jgi:hypothetical protein